jgi:hypothetical protein
MILAPPVPAVGLPRTRSLVVSRGAPAPPHPILGLSSVDPTSRVSPKATPPLTAGPPLPHNFPSCTPGRGGRGAPSAITHCAFTNAIPFHPIPWHEGHSPPAAAITATGQLQPDSQQSRWHDLVCTSEYGAACP